MRILQTVELRWTRTKIVEKWCDGGVVEELHLEAVNEERGISTLIRIRRFPEGWGAWNWETRKFRGPFRTALQAFRTEAPWYHRMRKALRLLQGQRH